MINKILVPVDGSAGSDRAVAQAIAIASSCGAKIYFLYVANINQLAINAYLSDAILAAVKKAGQVILERAEHMMPGDIEYEVPAVTILDFEKRLEIDLIVMGSRGLGLIKGVLLGSVSQYVVEQATCPVLVVKSGGDD